MAWKSSMIHQTYAYFYASSITIFLQPHIKSENLNYITRLRSLYATLRLLRRLLESALTQSSSSSNAGRSGAGTPATLSDARRAHAGSPAAGRPARTPWPPKQAGLVWCLCRIRAAARNLTRWRRCDWWRRLARRAPCRAMRAAWRHPPKRRSFRTFQNSGEL